MSQSNIKFNRVPLTKGTLVLDALWQHAKTDNDTYEELFYKLNPLVTAQHIPKDDVYLIPATDTANTSTNEDGLLLWD